MTDVRVLRVCQGFNGWSPRLAVVADGARSVLKLVGWTGGQGNPPPSNLYLGAIGYVTDIEDAIDIRGATGASSANAYLYVAYADDAIGTGFTLTFNDTKRYIAIKQTTSPIVSPVAGDFAGLWVIYSGNPDLSSYLTSATASSTYQTQAGMSSYLTTANAATTYTSITNSRYQFVSDAGTTYIVPASAVTANGNTIIELSNNSLTSITVNAATATGKTAGDSVTIHITGTYAAQILVASGVTLNGTLAFSANAKIKTLIYRGSNTWTVLGG